MDHQLSFERMAGPLNMESIPDSWRVHWPSYLAWESSGGEAFIRHIPDAAKRVYDLPDEVLPPLAQAFDRISSNAELYRMANFWHYMIFHRPEGTGDNPDGWPVPSGPLEELGSLFPIAVLVSGTQHAIDAFARLGVPRDVAYATLAAGGHYVRDYYRRHGRWGIAYLGWMRNHTQAKLFRLGRLTFNEAKFHWPFRIFRHRSTGELRTLCEASALYRSDGLANGTNGIADPDAWESVLDIGPDRITGNPVTKNGFARKEPVTLMAEEWEQIAAPGDCVIAVHVPSAEEAGKLLQDRCEAAYREAIRFFSAYFPETRFRMFTCYSWLLDPAFQSLLQPKSNIAIFQNQFHLLPVSGDERQTYDLVFGDSKADLDRFSCRTELQRSIRSHVRAGNKMRGAAGFFLKDRYDAK